MAQDKNLQQSIQFDDCSGCDFIVDQELMAPIQSSVAAPIPGGSHGGKSTHKFSITHPAGKTISAKFEKIKQPDGKTRGVITLLAE